MSTPDQAVRSQIDAIMAYLRAEGLADVEDPPEIRLKKADQHLHTIRATFDGKTRFLRVDYGWLSDHSPDGAVAWLRDKEIAQSLQADDYEITIHHGGMIEGS
jgi:hypothetical protein